MDELAFHTHLDRGVAVHRDRQAFAGCPGSISRLNLQLAVLTDSALDGQG